MRINLNRKVAQISCIFFCIIGVASIFIYCMLFKLSKYINLGYLAIFEKFTLEIIAVTILFAVACLILLFRNNRRLQTKRLKLKSCLLSIFGIIISSYVILCIFIYSVQDELINKNQIIFQPRVSSRTYYKEDKLEIINITTSDNIKLQGWLVKNSTNDKSPLIIYFGGSGQEVSGMMSYAKKLEGYSVAFFNYRGFGSSEGLPSQDNCFNDAKLIYDTLSQRKDIDSESIISMGWSLGTSVAVYLSDNRHIKGTVLVSPIDSMCNRLQQDFPLIPLSIIIKQQFNSISRAPNINSPLLCLIGDKDINVPPDVSMNLVNKWKGESTVKVYNGSDHNLLGTNSKSWLDIQDFLKSLE